MAIRYQVLLIIDIEATCWASKQAKPPDEVNEIIEIGVQPFNLQTWARAGEAESLLVKPIQSRVSDYCTKLTTITQTQVNKGTSLAAACNILRSKYNSKSIPWASWGDYDREMFITECRRKDIKYPFSSTHINIKALYAISRGLVKGSSMSSALHQLGLELEGTHHRGDADAHNIARILERLKLSL